MTKKKKKTTKKQYTFFGHAPYIKIIKFAIVMNDYYCKRVRCFRKQKKTKE